MFDASETPNSLLAGLKQHDERSWERFVAIAAPVLYAKCRRRGLSDSDAADLAQETFLKVRNGIDRFTKENAGDSFRKWLSVVFRNAAIDAARKRARTEQGTGDSAVQGMLENVASDIDEETTFTSDDSDSVQLFRQATKIIRDDFQEHVWQAFWLTQVEDVPAPEAAKKLDMKPTAVRQAAFRVRRRLKEQLEGLFD